MSDKTASPPRENIIRAQPGVHFRSAADVGDLEPGFLGVIDIRFSPVNEWATINSIYEGRFLERFAPNAWKKTIRERMSQIRALFQHGMDPQIGDKPLGPIRKLYEDDGGGFAEVALLDTTYNRDLVPGLRSNLYGASHRFKALRVIDDDRPARSDHNPDGLLERTIKEAQLYEFGPVTFPAYSGATAGMRSMTDDFLLRCFDENSDRVRTMFETYERSGIELGDGAPSRDDRSDFEIEPVDDERRPNDAQDTPPQPDQQDAPSEDDAEPTEEVHLADERRDEQTDATPQPVRRVTPIHALKPRTPRRPLMSLDQARKDRL